MYAKRRKIYDLGRIRVVPIPNGTPIAKDSIGTVAMDRLFLADLEGEYEPEELLKLLRKLEPEVWRKRTKSTRLTTTFTFRWRSAPPCASCA